MRFIGTVALGTLLCLAMGQASADKLPWPSNEDLRHTRAYEDLEVSPDGKSLLVQVREPTADGNRSHLWVTSTRQQLLRPLTFTQEPAKFSEYSGRWMPDGRTILFLSHRSDHTQVYQWSLDGGEPRQLDIQLPVQSTGSPADSSSSETISSEHSLRVPADIGSFGIQPGGHWIWFTSGDPQTLIEKQRIEKKDDALWVDHETHMTRLYLWNLDSSQLIPTSVPGNVREVAWSSDGTHLAALTNPPNNLGDLAPANKVWLVQVNSAMKAETLPECPPTASGVTWDKSGMRLYFNAQSRHTTLPVYPSLYMDDLTVHQISGIAGDVDGTLLGAMVSYGDDGVVVPVLKGLTWDVMSFDASGRPKVLKSFSGSITGLTANNARNTWAALLSQSGSPPELIVGRDPTRLTRTSTMPSFYSIGPRRSAIAQHVEWRLSGRTLQGLLYVPPDLNGRAVPLIVEAHGGPSDAYYDSHSVLVDFLVGQGWAVLRPNPRGSNGRGADFASANRRDLGGGDLDDILAGVDAALKNASLDGTRLAFIGYSYGGELGAFLEGRTPRFKAIVSGGPVTDQFSEYGTEIDSSYDRWFVGFPWQEFEVARRQSPLATIGHGKKGTPILILQAQNDIADPPGQSYELYRALRQQHIPVDLVTYPRDDHWSLENGINGDPVSEPWHGFDARKRISDFLHKELDSPE